MREETPRLAHSAQTAGPKRLFRAALGELDTLRGKPRHSSETWQWEDHRKEILKRLASLANHDPCILRLASLHDVARSRQRRAAKLLQDACYYAWRTGMQ